MTELSYRGAGPQDLANILAMEQSCFSSIDAFNPKQFKYMLKNRRGSIIVDLIEAKSEIVGYAVFLTRKNSQIVRLYSMCIKPQKTGQGLGKAYLTAKIEVLRGLYKAMRLEVRAGNSRALGLYQGLGFKVIKTLPGYYPDGERALQMEKEI